MKNRNFLSSCLNALKGQSVVHSDSFVSHVADVKDRELLAELMQSTAQPNAATDVQKSHYEAHMEAVRSNMC